MSSRINSGPRMAAGYPHRARSGAARVERRCFSFDTSSCGKGAGRAWGSACLLLLLLLLLASPVFAVPPGTLIDNAAGAAFQSHGNAVSVVSNTVSLTTQWQRTPAGITLLQYAPALSGASALTVPPTHYDPDGAAGGGTQQIAAIYPAGSTTPIDLSQPVPVIRTDLYHQGEPIFFQVADPDQNIDPSSRETIWVLLGCPGQDDNELLLLQETGPDSGRFAGCIQSSGRGPVQSFNGILDVAQETTITARYTDPADGADTVATTALVDPFGLVFDSSTGQPVDDVTLTLVDDASGQPARVYGDDGISTFPATITSGDTIVDSSGRVYEFESGRYRYPFVPPGRYRLSIHPPAGYGAPSTVATDVLQALPGAPFVIAEPGSRGEAFTLNPGPAVRMDIPVDPATGGLWLQKTAGRETAAVGDFIQYRLVLRNGSGGTATSLTLNDRLPAGFRYSKGSARLNGGRLDDPAVSKDGRSLVFGIGDLADGGSDDIRYVAEVAAGAHPGKARNTASASAENGLRSNSAFAVVTIKEDLFRSENVIVGRVIADNCEDLPVEKPDGVGGVRIYLENGTFVVTDEQGRYHFEGVSSGSHVVQMDLETLPEGLRPDEACGRNARAAGTAFSRFVDLQGGALWREDFHVATFMEDNAVGKAGSAKAKVEPVELQPEGPPVQDLEAINADTLAPVLAWVAPRPDFYPAIPNLKLAVSHLPARKIELLHNGMPVSPLASDGIRNSGNGRIAISLWSGVGLSDGVNRFTAVCRDANGRETGRIEKEVYYAGPPVKGEVVTSASRLKADGKQTPLIAVRLTDAAGHPVRYGVTGVFDVLPPHQAYRDEKKIQDEAIVRAAQAEPRFTVGRDGIAPIRLKPTTNSGFAAIRLHLDDRVQELRVWLRPEARQWILVGLAEGTAGYNQVAGNLQNLAAADMEEDFYKDGRVAFFAKGKVKGDWLLTAAYDSARDRDDPNTRFFQQLDPDTYYTLYGDTTAQQHEAASVRKLYLKIERERFYAMFGDFDTGLDVTELSAYSRRFNGIKTAYHGDILEASAFAADTNQAYIRDEIRGNGTSGLYRLSRRDLIINSEKITLETRDRFHSEMILSAVTLTRHLDYIIDYDNGTLFFKSPVYSRDAQFNPIYIVAEYEAEDPSDETYTYGGRAAVTTAGERLRIGATYVHEGPKNAEGNLGGLDARLDMGNGLEAKAEMAMTRKDQAGETLEGKAFLAEVSKQSKTFDAKAYVREQGADFGLGHQNGSEAETRKVGLEGAWRVDDRWTAAGELYRQSNLATDADRDVGELDITYHRRVYQLSAGLRQAEDRFADGTVDRSTQLLAGVSRQFLDNRLKLRANHEQALGGNDGNVDFPTRTILGADYRITEPVALFAEQEFTQGRERDTQSSRAGIRATPWKGGQVGTALGRGFDENGDRLYAALGLAQTWQIDERWRVDGGLDHSQTVDQTDGKQFNTAVPSASGSQEDFTALSLGAAYTAEKWSWTGRLETRYAQTQDKWGLVTGIAGQVRPGLGLSAGIKWFDTQSDSGSAETDGEVRLSLALRPDNSRWIILDRLDFKHENSETGSGDTEAHRIVNNFNANYKPNHRIQAAFQYGAKYVFDTFDSHTCEGYTDLTGLELRYELTPRWDAGLHAGALHSWTAGQIDFRTGVSVGYNLFKNAWVSAGYNFSGFEDADFSEADYTAQGPFVTFRVKFDQQSVKEMIDWFSK